MYDSDDAKAFWDIPVFAENQELGANRIDVRTIDRKKRQVIALEMSCSWIESRSKKEEEKTLKYSPLRWEVKQLYPRYEIQINIIRYVLGGWSSNLDTSIRELLGSRSKDVLRNMQKSVLSSTLNIALTFKVAT